MSSDLPRMAQLVDHLVPGGLEAFIAKYRPPNPKKSWDWIARELYLATDKKVDTTGVSVAAWWERMTEQAS